VATPAGEPRCIVLVEDDEDVLKATRFLLEMHGLHIEFGRTGAEIVPRCERGDWVPDLVIADYRLLDTETGIEVLERIRTVTGRHLPGFILTGDISAQVAAEAQAHDCRVFQKPVDPEQLVRSILGAVATAGVSA
jgi:CheY-like chemotaxis protein